MITCPECGFSEVDGTLFCSNCGSRLLSAEHIGGTSPADRNQTNLAPMPPLIGKRVGPQAGAEVIRIVVGSTGREVTMTTLDKIHIGRGDAERAVVPELDLAPDGAAEAGVSRLHAVILSTAQGLAIMDLESVNGTRVNGYRIPANLPFALNDSDTLILGDLKLSVFVEGE